MRTNSIKYLSIYEDLKEEIINGTYPIGGLFPAEPELQTLFGVSRITVRHAVQLLVDEGYLQRIHGVGTVVVSQKESLQLQNLLSFSEEYKGAGHSAACLMIQPFAVNSTPPHSAVTVVTSLTHFSENASIMRPAIMW